MNETSPMNIPVGLTISKPNGHKTVHVQVRCQRSGVTFVNLEMDLADFAEALMGLYNVPGQAVVGGLENVGKMYEHKPYSIPLPGTVKTYERDKIRQWLDDNVKVEGWHVNTYLGSQKSISYGDGKGDSAVANINLFRFVNFEDWRPPGYDYNPVFHSKIQDCWWFRDMEGDALGPFDTERDAIDGCLKYAERMSRKEK